MVVALVKGFKGFRMYAMRFTLGFVRTQCVLGQISHARFLMLRVLNAPPPAEQLRSRRSTAAAHCTRCSSRSCGKASRGGDERPQGSEQLQGDEDKRGGSGEGGSENRNETEGEYDKGGEAWNVVTEYNE